MCLGFKRSFQLWKSTVLNRYLLVLIGAHRCGVDQSGLLKYPNPKHWHPPAKHLFQFTPVKVGWCTKRATHSQIKENNGTENWLCSTLRCTIILNLAWKRETTLAFLVMNTTCHCACQQCCGSGSGSASFWYRGSASGSASASNKKPDSDPHPDSHQSDKLDPKPDPGPHQFAEVKP